MKIHSIQGGFFYFNNPDTDLKADPITINLDDTRFIPSSYQVLTKFYQNLFLMYSTLPDIRFW